MANSMLRKIRLSPVTQFFESHVKLKARARVKETIPMQIFKVKKCLGEVQVTRLAE
jgi:hypothetical protein